MSESHINSSDCIAYFMDGIIHEHTIEYHEAIASYCEVVTINKKCTAAYYKLGELNQIIGDYDKAIINYSHVIDAKPEYLAYFKRGVCYFESKNYKEAIQDFEKALGIILVIQNDYIYSEVYKFISEVTRKVLATLVPREEKVLRLKLGIGKMSLDDVHLGSIIAFHDGHLSINKAYHAKLIYRYLGESYEMNNQHMQAIKYWNRTIDIDPLNIDAYIMRGVCHYKTGNYLYAAGEFARAIRLDPQNSKAVETLTKILDRSLKFNRMINDLFALGESKDSLTNDDISAILSSYTFTSNEIDAVISYMHRKVTDIVDE